MRQRVMSPEGSLAHWAVSLRCRAASARQVESACSCARESCSCWYVVAAVSAAACVHLYCSTRHCAAPLASIVILLHSRTSAAFLAADLKQPRADRVTAAVSHALVQRILTSGGKRRERTGWDSNPRYPCGHTGFRDRPFQPLTHLSLRCDAREAETLSGSEDESRGEDRLFPQPSNPLKRLGASASLLRSG